MQGPQVEPGVVLELRAGETKVAGAARLDSREERAGKSRDPGELQRVPTEYSAEYSSAHAFEGRTI